MIQFCYDFMCGFWVQMGLIRRGTDPLISLKQFFMQWIIEIQFSVLSAWKRGIQLWQWLVVKLAPSNITFFKRILICFERQCHSSKDSVGCVKFSVGIHHCITDSLWSRIFRAGG